MASSGPQLKSTWVDIRKFPQKSNQNFVLGDLHGNTLKLLCFVIHTGLATLSQEDYGAFSKIYQKSSDLWNEEDIENIRRAISNLKKAHHVSGRIMLIGDTLADRGENDLLTLLLYDQLDNIGIPFNILLSNHDIEFICRVEKNNLAQSFHLYYDLCISVTRLHSLTVRNLVTLEEIKRLYKKAYAPALKLIDYSLRENGILIGSHGLIEVPTIGYLAKKFDVDYIDETVHELAHTIDQINLKFKEYVVNNKLHTLVDPLKVDMDEDAPLESDKYPIEFTISNRNANIQRPETHKGYPLWFVHGHNENHLKLNHVYNLDDDNFLGYTGQSRFGKTETYWDDKLIYLKPFAPSYVRSVSPPPPECEPIKDSPSYIDPITALFGLLKL